MTFHIVFGMAILTIPHLVVAQPKYTITDLGTLGGAASYAYGINNRGQVTGYSDTTNGLQHAFLYSSGMITDLGELPPCVGGTGITCEGSQGYGVNNAGQVVGFSYTTPNFHAFLYSGGTMTDLGTLGRDSFAYGINDSGQVTGYAYDSGGGPHAFLYNNGTMTDLGTLGGCCSDAYAINSSGQVVGVSSTTFLTDHAFLYSGGVMIDLGTLGGAASYAYGINDISQVVGTSITNTPPVYHAFLYSGGLMIDLGGLVGADYSQATGINTNGQVVGASRINGVWHAFLGSGGTITDITPTGWSNTLATGMNDTGDIVGYGNNPKGQVHAFLLTRTDTTPPVTLTTTSPVPNSNGWNNTDVMVTLTASDNPGGSGIKEIQFSLAGAQSMALQTVTGDAGSVTISAEGTTVLSYYATDNAGNQETTKTLTIKIDKTPPVISGMPAAGCTLWPPNGKMIQVATVTATDALSGISPGSFQVTGTSNEPPIAGEISITPNGDGGYVIALQADRLGTGAGRVYTLTATASDLAGNTATLTSSCTVPHDQGSN
jgi:probable HAF family extracellular repeat protein